MHGFYAVVRQIRRSNPKKVLIASREIAFALMPDSERGSYTNNDLIAYYRPYDSQNPTVALGDGPDDYIDLLFMTSCQFALSVVNPVTAANIQYTAFEQSSPLTWSIKGGDMVDIYECLSFGGEIQSRLMWAGYCAQPTSSESMSGKFVNLDCTNYIGKWDQQAFIGDENLLSEGFTNTNSNTIAMSKVIQHCVDNSYMSQDLNDIGPEVNYRNILTKDSNVWLYLQNNNTKLQALYGILETYSASIWQSIDQTHNSPMINIGLLGNNLSECNKSIWGFTEKQDKGTYSVSITDNVAEVPTEIKIWIGQQLATDPYTIMTNDKNIFYYKMTTPLARSQELADYGLTNTVTYNATGNVDDSTAAALLSLWTGYNKNLINFANNNGLNIDIIKENKVIQNNSTDQKWFSPSLFYGCCYMAQQLSKSLVATLTVPLTVIREKAVNNFLTAEDSFIDTESLFNRSVTSVMDSVDGIKPYFDVGIPIGVTLPFYFPALYDDPLLQELWCHTVNYSYSPQGMFVSLNYTKPYTWLPFWED